MSNLSVFDSFDNFWHYLDFDQKSWRFNRDILDSKPYTMVKKDKSTVIYLNCLGVNEKDIQITTNSEGRNNYLSITGETKIEDLQTYNVSAKFLINPEEIESIDYETKNGLLIVTVTFKTISKPDIPIKRKEHLNPSVGEKNIPINKGESYN